MEVFWCTYVVDYYVDHIMFHPVVRRVRTDASKWESYACTYAGSACRYGRTVGPSYSENALVPAMYFCAHKLSTYVWCNCKVFGLVLRCLYLLLTKVIIKVNGPVHHGTGTLTHDVATGDYLAWPHTYECIRYARREGPRRKVCSKGIGWAGYDGTLTHSLVQKSEGLLHTVLHGLVWRKQLTP